MSHNEFYKEGFSFFQVGMSTEDSNKCPYPIGSENKRKYWMDGFYDAYFENFFQNRNMGSYVSNSSFQDN